MFPALASMSGKGIGIVEDGGIAMQSDLTKRGINKKAIYWLGRFLLRNRVPLAIALFMEYQLIFWGGFPAGSWKINVLVIIVLYGGFFFISFWACLALAVVADWLHDRERLRDVLASALRYKDGDAAYKVALEHRKYKPIIDFYCFKPTSQLEWLRLAVEFGNVNAMLYLGSCYQHGYTRGCSEFANWLDGYEDIEKDEVEAAKWYRKAAEHGSAEGQVKLAYCYWRGNGVDRDETEAARWCRKAAEQGCAEAQCRFGDCCRDGWGVEKDESEAAKWYRKAAEQGHPDAKKALDELEAR